MRSSSTEVVFYWGHLPLMSSSTEVIYYWDCLPLRLSSPEVVFHWGHLQLRLYSTEIVFQGGRLPFFQKFQNWFRFYLSGPTNVIKQVLLISSNITTCLGGGGWVGVGEGWGWVGEIEIKANPASSWTWSLGWAMLESKFFSFPAISLPARVGVGGGNWN